ncbi:MULTISPECIES: hypothetical protein [Flavobacterium]|uniref:TonB C-terminal domain-containing protein n=1 Tax=Flavobacterium jumunjinense TaxID=998845 RepID=A0ABV5GJ55_9FLAO|nr:MULTISPECIES: hypothetical protein [Flavobacterium]
MKHILLILCSILIFSCTKKKENRKEEESAIKIYSKEDYYKHNGKKMIIIDTSCINKKKRAKEDIKKGKLSLHNLYSIYYRKNFNNSYDHHLKLMEKLLAKNNIILDTVFLPSDASCLRIIGFEKYCYQSIMHDHIKKKYGINYIDSLCNLVETDYVKTHPNRIYEVSECDLNYAENGEESFQQFLDHLEHKFIASFEYPKDYFYKVEKYFSYNSAKFTLDKSGRISNLEVKVKFQNPENEKFRDYFEKKLYNFINDTKFPAVTSCELKVKSNINITYINK